MRLEQRYPKASAKLKRVTTFLHNAEIKDKHYSVDRKFNAVGAADYKQTLVWAAGQMPAWLANKTPKSAQPESGRC